MQSSFNELINGNDIFKMHLNLEVKIYSELKNLNIILNIEI